MAVTESKEQTIFQGVPPSRGAIHVWPEHIEAVAASRAICNPQPRG